MLIKPESPDLESAIRALLLAAFPTPLEADLVDRLRRDGDLARFGFDVAAASGFASPYAGPYFMMLSLGGHALPVRSGSVAYAQAFRDLE